MARYADRDASWLKFNARVLAEAANEDNPPLERGKFLSIVSSNLDEFLMVRLGMLAQPEDGKRPSERTRKRLDELMRRVRKQVKKQYKVLNQLLLPALAEGGIRLLAPHELTEQQARWLSGYFDKDVSPALTPRMIDRERPFPLLAGRTLHMAALIEGKNEPPRLALVAVPSGIPRVTLLPMGAGKARGILIEDVIATHAARLFPGQRIVCCQPFRITRNADFFYDDRDAHNLIAEMRKNLKKRTWGKVVRMEVPRDFDDRLLSLLAKPLEVGARELFRVDGMLHPDFFMKQLHGLPGFDGMRYAPFEPRTDARLTARENIFKTIRAGDLFFHHPYDSFDPVVRFVREAAEDERVIAIKQTLYRVSGKSPIVAALTRAAQNGKQVTVLVEVRARFDEENNINWCLALEKAGCQVIYGYPKLKAHSKITLVVRREMSGLARYVHLGTGNYNDVTAKQYTDMGILTCDERLGEEAGAFFNLLTGFVKTQPMRELIVAPDAMRAAFERLIRREIKNASLGLYAAVTAKMNALVDAGMIDLLYEAADAGVRIDLIVRGICCLKTEGRENIRVRSIVGRFLEHARVYAFENGGDREVYLSSADWMPRNLNKRIELAFPVKDASIRARIQAILDVELSDNRKAWALGESGKYARVPRGEPPVNCQETMIAEAVQADRQKSAQPESAFGM